MIKIDWQGGAKMAATLQKVATEMPNKVRAALRAETEIEAKEVRARTPVDTGNLRDSVKVEEGDTKQRDVIAVQIVAGGPEAPYGLTVHEDLEAFHRVGQAKFLESVIRESAPHMQKRIAKRLELK